MPFKFNIGDKSGKTFKFELDNEGLLGKELHNILQGKELMPELEGYELEITGMSDIAGFTSMKDVPGIGLKKVLLTYGKGFHKRPKREGKKKQSNPTPKGIRLRKTVRGRVISPAISQINLKVIKPGAKSLSEIFSDQAGEKEAKENRKVKRQKVKAEKEVAEKPTESPATETQPAPEEKAETPSEPKKEAPKEEAKTEEKKE